MTTSASKNPRPLTASERLSMAMGLPTPPPMSEAERQEFERAEKRADEEAARFYRRRDQDAA